MNESSVREEPSPGCGRYDERYITLQSIGKGAFGFVKVGQRRSDGVKVGFCFSAVVAISWNSKTDNLEVKHLHIMQMLHYYIILVWLDWITKQTDQITEWTFMKELYIFLHDMILHCPCVWILYSWQRPKLPQIMDSSM